MTYFRIQTVMRRESDHESIPFAGGWALSSEYALHEKFTEEPRTALGRPAVPGRSVRLAGTHIDLSVLVPLYGAAVVAALLDAITREYLAGDLPKPQRYVYALRDFFTWLAGGQADPASIRARIYSQLVEQQCPDADDFEVLVYEFTGKLRNTTDKSVVNSESTRARSAYIATLRKIIRVLSSYEICPDVPPMYFGAGLHRGRRGHNPSLGELRSGLPTAADPPRMAGVMNLNRTRLAALRRELCQVFDGNWQAFAKASELRCDPTLPDLADLVAAARLLCQWRRRSRLDADSQRLVAHCFPPDDHERRKAGLLKYLAKHCDGRLILKGESERWRSLVNSCGPARELQASLGGTTESAVAAQLIVMIDSGFNLQPCEDLLVDPVVMQASQGRQILSTVTSHKMRTGGTLVASVLSEYEAPVALHNSDATITALEVIRRWRELSTLHRRRAVKEGLGAEQYLWIRDSHQRLYPVGVPESTAEAWYKIKARVTRDPILRDLDLKRKQVRTTVLQMKLADASLQTAAVALYANHSSERTTIQAYLNAGWFHAEMDELIRRFQELFEAMLIDDSLVPQSALGLSSDELGDRKRAAVENGLGFLCTSPPRPNHPPCVKIDTCTSCELLRFAPTQQSLENLVLAERSLTFAQGEFISRNPERWANAWLPTLALARAVISRVKETKWARRYEEALAKIDNGLRSGSLELIQPW